MSESSFFSETGQSTVNTTRNQLKQPPCCTRLDSRFSLMGTSLSRHLCAHTVSLGQVHRWGTPGSTRSGDIPHVVDTAVANTYLRSSLPKNHSLLIRKKSPSGPDRESCQSSAPKPQRKGRNPGGVPHQHCHRGPLPIFTWPPLLGPPHCFHSPSPAPMEVATPSEASGSFFSNKGWTPGPHKP